VTARVRFFRLGVCVKGRGWIAGVTISREFMRPNAERWPGFAFVDAFGVSAWLDTRDPMTVGERGVW
jgi:hypothetical protein